MSSKDFITFMHDHFSAIVQDRDGQSMLTDSGALQNIINFSLDIATNDGGALVERQSALGFLVNSWRVKPDFVDKNKEMCSEIVEALRFGCRDQKSKGMRTTAYYLTFSLLLDFGKDRNKNAPTIYHALTYMLIECYNNLEQRDDLLKNFVLVFTMHPNIPINILCDPLLKQI